MSIKIILLILLICIYNINGAKEHSDKVHTQTYYEWKSGDFTKTLYLEDTFIENGDICRQIDRQSYIKYLEDNNIFCYGDWCSADGSFSCSSDSTNCYNMEHIVDLSNSLFDDYPEESKKILGNVIMAYGKWNNQIGQLEWDNVEKEKREIYGNTIVSAAIENIARCHEKKYKSSSFSYVQLSTEDYEDIIGLEFVIICILALIISICGLLCCIYLCYPKINKKYITIDNKKDDNNLDV